VHRLKTCATINFLAASPPLDGDGLFFVCIANFPQHD